MPKILKILFGMVGVVVSFFNPQARAAELKVGDSAPLFSTQTHEGKAFEMANRRGKWTVLYFYPKAQTPGCTKQACAFRDSIEVIRKLNAEVYGISSDTVESQAKFHKNEHLNFPLLADANLKIIQAFGTKLPGVSMANRWTFIIDPELKIRAIDRDVDPVQDAAKTAERIAAFQKN